MSDVACSTDQDIIVTKDSLNANMSKLSDYRLLAFDVYGTLIDWETGLLTALEPLLYSSTATKTAKVPSLDNPKHTKEELLSIYHDLEAAQQSKTPDMKYSDLLATIHPQLASRLNLSTPSAEASREFGQSVGRWPAFPDTVDALTRLSKHYKLVVLSNVDVDSFKLTNSGPLGGVTFDAILTAQDIGSYKPNLRNFEYMLNEARERFGVDKEQILQTAQSQFHDHHPAKKMGIKSVWIVRPAGIMGNRAEEIYDWKFDTLGEMADALEGGDE